MCPNNTTIRKKQVFFLLFCLLPVLSFAQSEDDVYSRMQAIRNDGTDFMNVDGIEIASQPIYSPFSKKNIVKSFKKYSIKETDLTATDSTLGMENFHIAKAHKVSDEITQYTSYYFVKNTHDEITAITFTALHKTGKDFEWRMVNDICNNRVPKNLYTPLVVDSINFAGRKIDLGNRCKWMGVNNIECPLYGQMNWSVHKTIEGAAQSIKDQYNVIVAGNKGKIISDEMVDVVFEGRDAKARKIVFDPKGLVTSLLIRMAGAKALTVYFVAAPATKDYVSCVMSYWDRDYVNENGLPPLLSEVMKLKK